MKEWVNFLDRNWQVTNTPECQLHLKRFVIQVFAQKQKYDIENFYKCKIVSWILLVHNEIKYNYETI